VRLFVDDIRTADGEWTVVREITQAIRILATQKVDEVSLDHDIMMTSGVATTSSREDYTAVAWYIAAMPEEKRPKVVYVHTANPEGARRIKSILDGKVEKIVRQAAFGMGF
jgi:hypothetical protein